MPKNYEALPRTHLRRSDREVTDETWIKDFLQHAPVGVLSTEYDGQPFLNSNTFVYDESRNVLYLHTAHVGRTSANVQNNRRICFSVFEMGRLLPAETASNFSVEYAGVVIFGTATIVNDTQEAIDALHLLVHKYAPHLQRGKDYSPVIPADLARTGVYRIDIEEWSGKKKVAPDDFPGAYLYQDIDPVFQTHITRAKS